MKKRVISLVLIIAVFVTFLVSATISYIPVIDNFIASSRIKQYANTVYCKGSVNGIKYARYNPIDSAFVLKIKDLQNISCSSSGQITDKYRESVYLADNNLISVFDNLNSYNGTYGYLMCFWNYNSPDDTLLALVVQIDETDAGTSNPSLSTVKLEMCDAIMMYYNCIPEAYRNSIVRVRGNYRLHSPGYVQNVKQSNNYYRLDIDLQLSDEYLSPDIILSSTLFSK